MYDPHQPTFFIECFSNLQLVSKDDRKQLLFVLQLPSNKDHITKEEWFKVVLERGLTQSLGEAIWNALSNGCKYVSTLQLNFD